MESRAQDNEDTDDLLRISIITNFIRIMLLWLLSALFRPFPRIRREQIIHTGITSRSKPSHVMPHHGFAVQKERERTVAAFHIKYDDVGAAVWSRVAVAEEQEDRVARGAAGCTGSCAVTILYLRHEATRPRRALVRETLISCPLIPLKLVTFKLEISVRTIQFPEQRRLKRTRVVVAQLASLARLCANHPRDNPPSVASCTRCSRTGVFRRRGCSRRGNNKELCPRYLAAAATSLVPQQNALLSMHCISGLMCGRRSIVP